MGRRLERTQSRRELDIYIVSIMFACNQMQNGCETPYTQTNIGYSRRYIFYLKTNICSLNVNYIIKNKINNIILEQEKHLKNNSSYVIFILYMYFRILFGCNFVNHTTHT